MQAPISVVIPCYQCSLTIKQAVSSIANQTLLPSEVILVNDCSPDQTIEVLENLQNAHDKEWIKIINLPQNMGPGQARNQGWEAATQEYLAFLDADDVWHSRKLEIQGNWMFHNPEIHFSGHPRLIYKTAQDLSASALKGLKADPILVSKRQLLTSNLFPPSGWLFKRSLPKKFQPYYHSEDYLCLLENFFTIHKLAFFNLPLCYCLRPPYSQGGLSADLWKMEKGELQVYQKIWQEQYISLIEYGAISLYSFAKYLRRLFLTFLNPF